MISPLNPGMTSIGQTFHFLSVSLFVANNERHEDELMDKFYI